MNENRPVLEVKNLRIAATIRAPGRPPEDIQCVAGVSFTLAKGQVLGLIGESGAGKSTIGLAALGYARGGCRFSGGEVWLGNQDLLRAPPSVLRRVRGARVAYVAQSAAASFNPAHRLGRQVTEAAVAHGLMSQAQATRVAENLFARLGLPDPQAFGRRYPHQVSGGQLQRAMTAMAMCCEPELIVFDEPTTALDVTTQIEVLVSIRDAIRATQTSALYITHDLAVVAQIADEIMVLRYGATVEHGRTRQILEAPREDYTRSLVSVLSDIQAGGAAPVEQPVLATDAIHAAYDPVTPILSDVSVELHAGQTLAVVGESGSGKSTLARVITGLLPPQQGSVRFQGENLPAALKQRSKEQLRQLQMIYQMPDVAVNPRHTVAQIVGRPLEFYFGLRGAEKRRRVVELLEQIELGEDYRFRYPAELSGGQKQRVCIARALSARPELIICDEVTSALDPLVADGILKLLMRLQAQTRVAYLFITHDIATVRAIADAIAVMHRGRIVRYGRKRDVLAPPFDDYTALLLSSVPEMRPGWLEGVLESRAASPERAGDHRPS